MRTPADDSTRLAVQMKRRKGVTVTYTRGATSVSLTGWWGSGTEEVTNPDGTRARVDSTTRPLYFLASDLSLGTPMKGDRVSDGTTAYEVRPVGGGPAWQWDDPAYLIRKLRLTPVAA